ncbi:MAG: hypothetical protein P4K80_03465 [Acidobacteriaceae bacterium]|nr:hypothetical protein [Acidobacteriaceae bacterium]
MRKAKNANNNQVSERNFPASMVCQDAKPKIASTTSAIIMRPRLAGLRSTTAPNNSSYRYN